MDPTPAIDVALHDLAQNRETPSQLERHESGSHEQRRSHQEFSLPKADGGKEAWLFLAGCFFIEGLVWGTCIYLDQTLSFFRDIVDIASSEAGPIKCLT